MQAARLALYRNGVMPPTPLVLAQAGRQLGRSLERLRRILRKLGMQACALRVLFTLQDNQMALLHAFIKKTQATPAQEIALAQDRIDF